MVHLEYFLLLTCLVQLHAFGTFRRLHLSGRHRFLLTSTSDAAPASIGGNVSDEDFDESYAWESSLELSTSLPVMSKSSLFDSRLKFNVLAESIQSTARSNLLWEQAISEAQHALAIEPEAGTQLYQGILCHKSLLEAIVTNIAHQIETELITANAIRNLFLESLTPEDEKAIELDLLAVAMRSPSSGNIMTTILFHKGFQALVCYRVGHRLWEAGRSGLAYYLQSTVSRKFSADIHPAAKIGAGTFLSSGICIVIGETAVVGQDTSIFHGVTLGGTGKESGDRHPKVGNGVILHAGATVLGNIPVGDGAEVLPKSIVTKPVPFLARVRGVPARIQSYRELTDEEFDSSDLSRHLGFKYKEEWRNLAAKQNEI